MPSGAKKRKASRKKKELEAFTHGSKAETIIQDATGLTRTHPTEGVKSADGVPESQDKPVKEDIDEGLNVAEFVQEGSEVNFIVPGLKEKDVFASGSPSVNIEEVVLPLQIKDVEIRDNIEENDERIQDVVVTDNVVKWDTSEIFTENLSEEFPVLDVAVHSDLPSSILPVEKQGFTNPTLSFHIHTAGLDFPTADESIPDVVIVDNVVNQVTIKASTEDLSKEEFTTRDDAVPSYFPTRILPKDNVENLLNQADQEDEIGTVNLLSHDGTKGTSAEDQNCLNCTLTLDGDKENILGDEKDVEMKKKVQIMLEVCSKFKKMIEEQLNASNKFREILLKTLDDLNSMQLPEVM